MLNNKISRRASKELIKIEELPLEQKRIVFNEVEILHCGKAPKAL